MARAKKTWPPEVLEALRADWIGSTLSPNEMQEKHGIPRSTIRDLFAGVEREGGEKKRALIRAAAAGISQGMDPAKFDAMVRKEADIDVTVLGTAADNAKGILAQVAATLERLNAPPKENETAGEKMERIESRCPRALLQLSQANAHALEAWRRARELDAPEQAPRKARVTFVDPE
jgi:hypothetical protein